MRVIALVAAVLLSGAACAAPAPKADADPSACPNGKVRFAVEPYEANTDLLPAYEAIAKQLEAKLGCKVELTITTNYTSEIEAMRAGKLEVAQFGPQGYIFARQLAKAEVFATFADDAGKAATYYASVVTNVHSGLSGDIKACKDKQMAYSEASSTSGYLFPAYAFKSAGIDPRNDVKAVFTGGHAQAYEAVKANKVECAELNSERIAIAKKAGQYQESDFVTLWKSPDIFTDAIAVRGELTPALKERIRDAFLSLDFSKLDEKAQKILLGQSLVKAGEDNYKVVEDLIGTMGIKVESLDKSRSSKSRDCPNGTTTEPSRSRTPHCGSSRASWWSSWATTDPASRPCCAARSG
jgi:phosphonate transport system substrate-binding protein